MARSTTPATLLIGDVTYSVVYGFGGFTQPLHKSTMAYKAGSMIPVEFELTDASGDPIPAPIAAALAAAGQVKATLGGQGIRPESTVCRWEATDSVFNCDVETAKLGSIGTRYPYTITAAESVTGEFVTAPGVVEPPTHYRSSPSRRREAPCERRAVTARLPVTRA